MTASHRPALRASLSPAGTDTDDQDHPSWVTNNRPSQQRTPTMKTKANHMLCSEPGCTRPAAFRVSPLVLTEESGDDEMPTLPTCKLHLALTVLRGSEQMPKHAVWQVKAIRSATDHAVGIELGGAA